MKKLQKKLAKTQAAKQGKDLKQVAKDVEMNMDDNNSE